MKCKIYINDELLGYTDDPISFTHEMREKRRNGEISNQMNITYYEDANEICIFNDSGRARRPLIIVKDGIPLLSEEHLIKVANGRLEWDDLIRYGLIEFLDAEEEENSYIAMTLDDLSDEHTHMEIDPAAMLGICAGIIPFSDHNSSPRNTMEAGMTKQALGLYVSNYTLRTDTRAHLLHHPQTPIVKTRIIDSTNYDLRPSGQNLVVALMSYDGYNMEDAMVISKSALERGLGRSSFFRAYDTSEKRYAGGQVDRFEVPDKKVKGYRFEDAYRNLDDDGVVNPESKVKSGDVLIGKTSPPRFLEFDEYGYCYDVRRETSVTVRNGEKGIVDAVLLSETSEGSRLAKIRVRDTRQPELGDKFASRHGQKGVIGLIVSPEDMPFSEFGVIPDLIVNPHAIPARMSIGQVLEMVAGKAGCIEGERIDATPFNKDLQEQIKLQLICNGFEHAGCESLYDGRTGERFDAEIFIGVAYYQKLHHMTIDKIYARSRGPVQVLTRQPTEGRELEGGVRFGEMERDCIIAHGAAITLKERLLDESDKYEAIVCENCGMLGVFDKNKNKKYCPICGDVETYPVEIAYSFKLFLDELKALCVFPKLVLGDKTESSFYAPIMSNFKVKPLEKNKNVISGIRLSDEEPTTSDDTIQDDEKLENCEICGKKLNKNQIRVCKSCARKQYASRIVKKLVSVVKPGIPFKKQDLKFLNLDEIQIKDYMWTLQEFNLVEINGNKFMLKDEKTLNEFRIACKFEPIDFDDVDSGDRLDKTCKTCGKTMPISKFYKTSNGYEDNCKNCKKLIVSANYLNDIIHNIGFNKKFCDNDLCSFIPNQNQLMGIIWSLQDNDLLIEKSSNQYILEDKSKCIKFLEKYYKSTSNISYSKKNQDVSNDKEQMKLVLNAVKSGKTRKEAAKITDISLDRITYWYTEGKKGSGYDNIQFYKRLKKIEDRLSDKNDKSLEKNQMDFVLKLLGQGKSMSQAADISGIKITKILSWVNKGKDNQSEDTIYFCNEMNKILNKDNKISKEKIITKSSSNSKSYSDEGLNRDLEYDKNENISETATNNETGGILNRLQKLYEEDK